MPNPRPNRKQIYGDVNYYDQLGIPPNASPETIKQAYRSLVRLLHPDAQTDPDLKLAAERQLLKLNRIHSILVDPPQRSAYDEFLGDDLAPPVLEDAREDHLRKNLIRVAWVLGTIATLALIFWLGAESAPNESLPRPLAKAPAAPRPSQTPTTDPAQFQSQLQAALAERDQAQQELVRLRATNSRSLLPRLLALPENVQSRPPKSPVPVITELPSSNTNLSPAPPAANTPPPTPAVNRKLAGVWLYVRPKDGQKNTDKSLYPPEFIEINVKDDNGIIKGNYRARYRILDRPISPDVNFEFTGKLNSASCACSWRGIAGARGQINLQLAGDNSMKFDWSATELGVQQGLAAGTATLTRRIE